LLLFATIPIGLLLGFHDNIGQALAPEIGLARPWVLLLLLAIPAAAILLRQWHRVKRTKLMFFASPSLIDRLQPGHSQTRRDIKGWLLALAWSFLLVTWAGPQWGTKVRILQRSGIDVVISIDVSESMLAQDAPTLHPQQTQRRLQLARQKIRALMQMLENERIGIIAFAGKSFVLCPLTNDHNTCASWLESFEPHLIPYDGTALETTIRKAIPMFETSGTNSRAIFLLSDGDDHEKNTLEAAKEAHSKNIRIYTLGFGSPDITIIPASQLPPPAHGESPDERPIQTKLNEKLLEQIAADTKAIYRRAEASHRDVRTLYEHASQHLEKHTQKSERIVIREERFPIFAGIGLFLLILHWGFRERKEKT
jgi:Ca-activated chloride channel family protein